MGVKHDKGGLTAKERRFVEAYFRLDSNATRAAMAAGISETPGAAAVAGHRLVRTPNVWKEIERIRNERYIQSEMTIADTVELIKHHAAWDPVELAEYEITGPEDISRLPVHIRKCIQGWEYDRFGRFRLKLVDRQKAVEQMARHQGIFNDNMTVTVTDYARVAGSVKARAQDDAIVDE